MGFWKILGGIAAGVGAVALLPVAGAVGAVTATGAIVGGTVGAVVAAGTDDEDEKKRLRRENERIAASSATVASKAQQAVAEAKKQVEVANVKTKQAEARADNAEEHLRKAAESLEGYRVSLKDVESHYQWVIALTAIGMAAANADGHVDESETGEMDEYISGIAAVNLPAKVKARIRYLHNHPPSFEKAAAELSKCDKAGLPFDTIRQLIVDVIEADGVVEDSERSFLTKWDNLVSNDMVPVMAVATPAKKKTEAKVPSAKENAVAVDCSQKSISKVKRSAVQKIASAKRVTGVKKSGGKAATPKTVAAKVSAKGRVTKKHE